MKYSRTKFLIILALIVLLTYFFSDFSLINIQKTAIIISIGIDKKDDGYEITAQIGVPVTSDQSSSNEDANIFSSGKTVYEAIDNIGIITGWHPKLSFCELILFGRDVVNDDILGVVDHLISSRKILNSVQLAVCDTTAKEILLATTPLDTISSFALQKILLKNALKVNTVSDIDMRKFALLNYSPSQTSFMPIVKTVEIDNETTPGSKTVSNTDAGADNPSEKENSNVIFDATSTAVIKNGKLACELTKDETLAFNLITKGVSESYLPIVKGDETLLIAITKNTKKISVSFAEKPTVNLKLCLSVSIADSTNSISLEQMSNPALLSFEDLEIIKQKMASTFEGLIQKLNDNDCDLFQAKTLIYKFHHPHYENLKDLSMQNFNHSINIQVSSID